MRVYHHRKEGGKVGNSPVAESLPCSHIAYATCVRYSCQNFLVRFNQCSTLMKLFLVRHGETVDNVAQV